MDPLSTIGDFIRQQREAAEVSVRELARVAGISNPYLSQIERGLRIPSAEVLNQLAKAFSISAETLYVRAGILDEHAETDLVEHIQRDPGLTDRQKQTLIEVYRSFTAETSAGGTPEDHG